jgi:hypothetical protein
MTSRIVDTNVWLAASGSDAAGAECQQTCFEWMKAFRKSGANLVVDRASFLPEAVPGTSVLQELRQNLAPGAFARTLLNDHFMRGYLFDLVELEYDGEGAMLPESIELPGFEPADRKWVALHLGHDRQPPIHNACDGDWIKHEADLESAGIRVVQLCEAELRARVGAREGKQATSGSPRRSTTGAKPRKRR